MEDGGLGGVTRHRYGDARAQFAELHRPQGPVRGLAVVLVHGGYWRDRYGLDLMDPLCRDLAVRGWLVWNLEYRRIGETGGGWPGTFEDVVTGIAHLRTVVPDVPPVVLVGHSAGGHLSLWAASRIDGLEIAGVIGLGTLADLVAASEAGLSDGAADRLLGTRPEDDPERFRFASATTAPPTVPILLMRARDDEDVPSEQTELMAEAARRAGSPVEIVEVDGTHMDLIDPAGAAWTRVRRHLAGAGP